MESRKYEHLKAGDGSYGGGSQLKLYHTGYGLWDHH